MEIKERHLSTPKTARYYIAGEPSEKTQNIWFVIHGFGQLAGEFIKQFEYLVTAETIAIAPEALSRSYFGDKPGASWMTKEDRENEIKDYVTYLDNLYAEVLSNIPNKNPKVSVLGFSQGVHTAARWFALGKFNFSNLILCSSDFPRDTDFPKFKEKLKTSKLYYIWSDRDEFIRKEAFEANVSFLNENNIAFENIHIGGKHVIHHEIIKKIAASTRK
jgi:predicted esterase